MGGKNNALDVTIDLIQVVTSGLAKMSVITGAQWIEITYLKLTHCWTLLILNSHYLVNTKQIFTHTSSISTGLQNKGIYLADAVGLIRLVV